MSTHSIFKRATYLTNDNEEIERLSTHIGEEFVISEDLSNDPRFKDLGLTYDNVKINFFVKYPFYDKRNHQIGSIILLDVTPKYFLIPGYAVD